MASSSPQPTPTPTPGRPREQHMAMEHPVDVKTWGIFAHLSTLTYLIAGIGAFAGPMIVWLVGKDKHPTIDAHGKEALNFGITVAIIAAVLWIIGPILTLALGAALGPIGLLFAILVPILWVALFVFWLVFMILGTVAATKERVYHYPVSFRFVK